MLDLLGGLLARVPIKAPPADEQAAILAALFPELVPLVPAAMETLATVHAATDRHAACPAHACSAWTLSFITHKQQYVHLTVALNQPH